MAASCWSSSTNARARCNGIRKRALTVGTSLQLSYLLARSEQCLERLRELVAILAVATASTAPGTATEAWAEFAHDAFLAENRRNSLGHYMAQLSRLLAVRVTENAARSGEHYICETAGDYRQMWRSAAGAGVLIGGMALLKIFAAGLHAPLFVEAFLFSMIYGLGFVLIYLLGMTVATKQPAMTAQTLAGLLGDVRATRQAELERIVDVFAAVCRSQLAAIAGNVVMALPVAIAIGFWLGQLQDHPVIPLEKGAHLLADLDPLSWALPHAAIAGFYLFLSGLITGYFDNRAAYNDIGIRIARLRWLRRLAGAARAASIGAYIQDHLGGIMGNFLFGCMLGSTGVIGIIPRAAARYPAHRLLVGQPRVCADQLPVCAAGDGDRLGGTRHRADRADQSRGQFCAGAAHRARRPWCSFRALGRAAQGDLGAFPQRSAEFRAATAGHGNRRSRLK